MASSRTEAPARIIRSLGLEKPMFEDADQEIFAWYIKNYGPSGARRARGAGC